MDQEAPEVLELSQGVTLLNLSTESGFYSDWKQAYHVDTEQAILNPYPTDTIMPSITRSISAVCAQLQLSHTVEFSSIDTMEQLLIKIIAEGGGASGARTNFLQQVPVYVVSVVSVVSKYFDAHTALDRNAIKRLLANSNPAFVWSDKRMMELEFEILKTLNHKIYHSLLLGAVERFSKDHILTLGVVRKDLFGSFGIKLLRVVYAQKFNIYQSLRSRVCSEDMFVRFKSNKLILAAAIVMAVMKLCSCDQQQTQDRVVDTLSNECFVESLNIIFLRDAILSVLD
ncbi:uncharacterized protein LOC135713884 [Ochlerotatus camptorhynchus]|uniref:uncharacterized protein LOC135699825 n=1 Tax=Ochlerotatus camptorhynchus TaxID=644619 RepID=UPI0031CEA628